MRPATIACVLAVVSIVVSVIPRIDITVAAYLACPGDTVWCHKADQPWEWLYRFGPLPPVACGVVGIGLALAGGVRRNRPVRTAGIFLAANLLLGPGILGNSTKFLWGRPRPRHIEQFGGTQQYRPVWAPRPGARGTSFPSGHVVTAFSLGGISVLAASPVARGALVLASLVYGTLMGIARMTQGAHFATDVTWSATLAWVAIAMAARAAFARERPSGRPSHGGDGQSEGRRSSPAPPVR
ncbi:phosphatase PAP2 family protein [Candidatus Fermentibacteria bacterium]|nr:phosphatase PAP2 family protein [Candidatus Fermentibacteria bacterium]